MDTLRKPQATPADTGFSGIPETLEEAFQIWVNTKPDDSDETYLSEKYSTCVDFATITSKEDFYALLPLTVRSNNTDEAEVAAIGAAWNPKIMSGEWDLLACDMPARIFRALIEKHPISWTMINQLSHLTTNGNHVGSLAKRTHWLPDEMLEYLAAENAYGDGEALAHREGVTDAVKWSLVRCPYIHIRAEIAERADLTDEMKDELSRDEFSITLFSLMRQKHLSDYALTQLSQSVHMDVRLILASRPQPLPVDALWSLIVNPGSPSAVRVSALSRQDVPEEIRVAAGLLR